MGAFHSKIVGVTAKNPNGISRQKYIEVYAKKGKALILKREPDNQHDKNAIGVHLLIRRLFLFTEEVQLGYIAKEIALELAAWIDKGGRVEVSIVEVTGGGKKSFGVNILIKKIPS